MTYIDGRSPTEAHRTVAGTSSSGIGQGTDLSLVVCTRNRASCLRGALLSFLRLHTTRSWELIIVDNGSSDTTQLVLAEFGALFRGRFLLVDEPIAGLARARNAGWRRARGTVIAFTDDDCYPSADYLGKLWDCFNDERIGFVGGRVLLHDPSDYPITIAERDLRTEYRPGAFIHAGEIHGANFAFRRTVLERIDGFDVRLGAGTPYPAEDIDAVMRASAAGWRGAFDPRPVVFHHHRRKAGPAVDVLRRTYDFGRGAYYVKCLLDRRIRASCLRELAVLTTRIAIQQRAWGQLSREIRGAIGYLRDRTASGP